jgi:D-glycero-alpha-D-manno-heptose-7-phosphate kinase
MIISRSPLRITLGGGGTDLHSYYSKRGGFLISAAIDKYVYVTITKPFAKGIYLKYSKLENVKKITDIGHSIIKETLKLLNNKEDQIEITTLTDIPAGTGLGSSGSFTTALIKCLKAYYRKDIDKSLLAQLACYIEINKLKEPIGKQDQYIASFGGITTFKFNKNGKVNIKPLNLSKGFTDELEDNLLLFFTGYSRSASKILKDQKIKSEQNNLDIMNNLDLTKKIGILSERALLKENLKEFASCMNMQWDVKFKRSPGMSNSNITKWYELALNNGAIGGKLVGAGGGGFLLFVAKDKNKLKKTLKDQGLQEVRFKFDYEGTKNIVV